MPNIPVVHCSGKCEHNPNGSTLRLVSAEAIEPMIQVSLDRMEILKYSIDRHDWMSVQFEFDRVLRSLTKIKEAVKP